MVPNCSIDKDFKLGHFTGTFRNCVLDKLPVEKEDKFGHRSKTTSINLEKALSVDDEHGTPIDHFKQQFLVLIKIIIFVMAIVSRVQIIDSETFNLIWRAENTLKNITTKDCINRTRNETEIFSTFFNCLIWSALWYWKIETSKSNQIPNSNSFKFGNKDNFEINTSSGQIFQIESVSILSLLDKNSYNDRYSEAIERNFEFHDP
uniref:Uncharacterized protein n=1 Tax=Romanomermis culicivorax TaxID=13658 RepID=A0A915HRG0_ROMCU